MKSSVNFFISIVKYLFLPVQTDNIFYYLLSCWSYFKFITTRNSLSKNKLFKNCFNQIVLCAVDVNVTCSALNTDKGIIGCFYSGKFKLCITRNE